MKLKTTAAALLAAGLLAGCNFAPTYQRPDAPVPGTLNQQAGADAATAAADWQPLAWQQWVQDESLRQLIALALEGNRDLRVAVANMERARAQYGVQRADLLPTVAASAQGNRSRTADDLTTAGRANTTGQYSVQLGLASYELDLWGRVRNLSEAALQQYLQTEESRRVVQLGLVTDVANAWLALAADQQRLQLARDTLAAREHSYQLAQRMQALGATNGLVLAQNQTTLEAARGDVANYETQVARDRNALQLLLGAPVPAQYLPASPQPSFSVQALQSGGLKGDALPGLQPVAALTGSTALTPVPGDLPSSVLLARPDVAAAERSLQASYASIGAARAAFFPTISLTANVGTASSQLDGLFGSGNGTWSFIPQLRLPIFDAGRNQANLGVANANRDATLAQYEKSIQTAFREVNDALADRATLQRRLQAQAGQVDAAGKVLSLSQARFRAGADDFLTVLDAQRSLYTAQQTQITLLQSEQVNRIALYKALGGGWGQEGTQKE
ncbi:efflux transporter outer membrane subunit [Comamonas humi]